MLFYNETTHIAAIQAEGGYTFKSQFYVRFLRSIFPKEMVYNILKIL